MKKLWGKVHIKCTRGQDNGTTLVLVVHSGVCMIGNGANSKKVLVQLVLIVTVQILILAILQAGFIDDH